MADFVSGMNSGLNTARSMIYGNEQAQAETSLLSTKAAEGKLALSEHQQSYAANMALYSSEKDFAKTNTQIDISTARGMDQMYTKLAESPNLKSNPVAMQRLYQLKQDNMKRMQAAELDATKIKVEEMQQTHDALNVVLGNPTDATGWKGAIDAAPTPALKSFLTKQQQYFNGDEYNALSPKEQAVKQREVLGHITAGAQVGRENYQLAQTVQASDNAAQKKDHDAEALRVKAQVAAAARNAKEHVAETKSAKDFTALQTRLRTQHDAATKKIEDQKRALLNAAGAVASDDTKKDWGFFAHNVLNKQQQATYADLTMQQNRADKSFKENIDAATKTHAKDLTITPKAAKLSTYTEANPAKLTDQDSFNALKPGDWFINPADGKVLKKK